jgi:hypothetical protein
MSGVSETDQPQWRSSSIILPTIAAAFIGMI